MSPGKNRFSATRQTGFTIVEIVVTLIIVGILAAVAVPRFFDRQSFDARAFFDQTQSMLRFAQKLAIAQNRPVSVRLNGSSIALCYDQAAACAIANQVFSPSGTSNSQSPATLAQCGGAARAAWFCEAPSTSGITYTSAPAIASFYFNELGRPYNAADNPNGASTLNANLLITIRDANAGSLVITVERETGYVH